MDDTTRPLATIRGPVIGAFVKQEIMHAQDQVAKFRRIWRCLSSVDFKQTFAQAADCRIAEYSQVQPQAPSEIFDFRCSAPNCTVLRDTTYEVFDPFSINRITTPTG